MKKYKRKPTIVEAQVWNKFGDIPEAGIQPYTPESVKGILSTPEGGRKVSPGDYIIRIEFEKNEKKIEYMKEKKKGEIINKPVETIKKIKVIEFYPIKPDVFERNYEELYK